MIVPPPLVICNLPIIRIQEVPSWHPLGFRMPKGLELHGYGFLLLGHCHHLCHEISQLLLHNIFLVLACYKSNYSRMTHYSIKFSSKSGCFPRQISFTSNIGGHCHEICNQGPKLISWLGGIVCASN